MWFYDKFHLVPLAYNYTKSLSHIARKSAIVLKHRFLDIIPNEVAGVRLMQDIGHMGTPTSTDWQDVAIAASVWKFATQPPSALVIRRVHRRIVDIADRRSRITHIIPTLVQHTIRINNK